MEKPQRQERSPWNPVEVFKAPTMETDSSLQWLLDLCNHCWRNEAIPPEWSAASVAMLLKKATLHAYLADANNHYPICLQSIEYKVFASLFMQHLLAAGAEDRQIAIRLQDGSFHRRYSFRGVAKD